MAGAAAAATANRLYYDPARPTAFSTLRKLGVAAKKKNIKLDDIRDWLEKQDAYTLHRPIRKRFARNPYTVNNVMGVWECDLVEVRALGRFNDNYKYILSVIDVFSKFLHQVRLRSNTGTSLGQHSHRYSMTLVDAATIGVPSGCERTRAKNS